MRGLRKGRLRGAGGNARPLPFGISASVEACAHGEAAGFLMNADVVLTSPEIVEMLPPTDAKIITTTSMLDKAVVTELLVNCVKENFPDEIR